MAFVYHVYAQGVHKFFSAEQKKILLENLTSYIQNKFEKVSMKWMDRPSVTDMDKGGVYEMDRQTKFQKS